MAATATDPYTGADIEAAYKAIFGGLPASMMDLKTGNIRPEFDKIYPGTVLKTPTGQEIQASQLMSTYQQGQTGAAAGGQAPGAAGAVPSYLSGSQAANTRQAANIQGIANMATNSYYSPTTGQPQVSDQQAIQYYVSMGGNPNIDPATARAYFTAKNPNFGQSGVNPQDAINYYIQQGGNPQIDPATAVSFYEAQHPDVMAKGVANAAMTPEQRALGQMQTIDPASETLRTALASSYLTPLQQAGAPKASDYQSYL